MYKYIKRFLDILVSLLVIPFILVLLALLFFIVKLESKGPFFYVSERIGINTKKYRMFKIRTMAYNAPDIRNSDGSTFNSDNDPRVTKLGRILRKTSLDELPQIFNVLLGNMSFIGPRPDLYSQKEYYYTNNLSLDKFKVRPGITGYAQVNGRNSISWSEKNKLDVYYVNHISLLLDIKILLQTFLYVVARKNINKNEG